MENKNKTESIKISKSKYQLLQNILKNVHESLGKIIQLLESEAEETSDFEQSLSGVSQTLRQAENDLSLLGNEKIIEGVFDGEKMISSDGQEYVVPANYASKSKLVEGDILKLTITKNGDFKYKQIGPVDRDRLVGKLTDDAKGQFFVVVDKKKWKILPASVSFFKGSTGDETVILVPKDARSKWAAVENIVKK